MNSTVHIIGSGFSSLSAACYLAKAGYAVTVLEKNETFGGRARQFSHEGFKFDMGPTWYWMPDVFEDFFKDFGKTVDSFYTLEKLDPAYRVYFGKNDWIDIDGSLKKISNTFESIEKGSSIKLNNFIDRAKKNYEIAIKKLVYKPGLSPTELITRETIFELKQFYQTIHDFVKKTFSNPRLQQILEFPVLFLGAKPSNTPLFYNFMNYADFGLGTWYPKGGMRSVVDGIISLAGELGVTFQSNAAITKINVDNHIVESIEVNRQTIPVELLVSGADYRHTELLLPPEYHSYSEKYWNRKVMAPSSLLFYVGFSKKIERVLHHTLFFDVPFTQHAEEIYDRPSWPEKPLFYASFPGKSDSTILPEGMEAGTFLIPLAPDLTDTDELREKYFSIIMERLEKLTGQDLKSSILFKKSYCVNDFKEDYNSFKGNAYGMANTLMQTAFLRPKIKSNKVHNLYFTGQLTVPGPGVPPALISGKIVADLIRKKNQQPVNQ